MEWTDWSMHKHFTNKVLWNTSVLKERIENNQNESVILIEYLRGPIYQSRLIFCVGRQPTYPFNVDFIVKSNEIDKIYGSTTDACLISTVFVFTFCRHFYCKSILNLKVSTIGRYLSITTKFLPIAKIVRFKKRLFDIMFLASKQELRRQVGNYLYILYYRVIIFYRLEASLNYFGAVLIEKEGDFLRE